nr:aspartate-semialdehyde dehydrogenase [Rubeoparvulum massiliense]
MPMKKHLAIVGATGAVGQEILRILEQYQLPVDQITLLSSKRSAGTELTVRGERLTVQEATPDSFQGVDVALFSAGGTVSKLLVPEAVQRGAVAVDNTNAYRMDPHVPLVVPEVNGEAIKEHQGIIANPNCSTTQMVMALHPLRQAYGMRRIIVSTYQAVSGAGHSAMVELENETKGILEGEKVTPTILPSAALPVHYPIAFNVIPQIDRFEPNDYTLEEMKMVRETKKIFQDATLEVAATCVRVPVFRGHSESVYVELEQEVSKEDVISSLQAMAGVIVVDNPEKQQYPMPIDGVGKPEVYVGRIRRDLDHPNGWHLWIVSDNLWKGAAWNTVQIADQILKS